ncbi:MAG: hypothetical protein QXG65_03505 [Thermoplasmata archaeon]
MVPESEEIGKGLVEGAIDALTNKHSQLDLHLRGLTVSMGDKRLALHISGDVTVAVHMRELTDEERSAHAAANIARMSS